MKTLLTVLMVFCMTTGLQACGTDANTADETENNSGDKLVVLFDDKW